MNTGLPYIYIFTKINDIVAGNKYPMPPYISWRFVMGLFITSQYKLWQTIEVQKQLPIMEKLDKYASN